MTKAVITSVNSIQFLFLYENDELVECHPLLKDNSLQIGNVYVGRVEKVVKNIQSAFVRLDEENVGYLPLDDSPYICLNRQLPKGLPSIAENDLILVQVLQEPMKLKQARITGNISLGGRLIAIDLDKGRNGISKKIKNEVRKEELKSLILNESIYGHVIRTDSEEASDEQILDEYKYLCDKMDELIHKATYQKRQGLLVSDQETYVKILDSYGFSRIDQIKTDSVEVFTVLEPILGSKVALYEEEYPLAKLLGLETELSHILSQKVWLKSGGFLIIEPTEAMVVIDVNTGKSIGKKNREEHVIKINKEAALEITRQIRLRNLSGIIMVDFINMEEERRKELAAFITKELSKDKVPSYLVDITKLELYEITRKKIRKPIYEFLNSDLKII